MTLWFTFRVTLISVHMTLRITFRVTLIRGHMNLWFTLSVTLLQPSCRRFVGGGTTLLFKVNILSLVTRPLSCPGRTMSAEPDWSWWPLDGDPEPRRTALKQSPLHPRVDVAELALNL